MHRLSNALKKYLIERTNNDEYWKDLTVVFSDAGVPGEGEHKILDFIRG
jgi:5'-3' exoribonuclease 2